MVLPFPSWPVSFLPQHLTAPVVVTMQLKVSPAEMDETPEESVGTSTGVELLVTAADWPSCRY